MEERIKYKYATENPNDPGPYTKNNIPEKKPIKKETNKKLTKKDLNFFKDKLGEIRILSNTVLKGGSNRGQLEKIGEIVKELLKKLE